jgi:parvulin-like peptidyl-prolyl isomerase
VKTIVWIVVVALVAMPATARQRAVASHAAAVPRREAPREVARVNGTRLMSDRLDAAVNALVPRESFHRTVPAEKLAAIRQQALRSLVDDELVYQDGVRRGTVVRAAEIDAALARTASRYPNRQAFLAALRRSGATLAGARREIRRSLIIEKTRARAVQSTCGVSRADASSYFSSNVARFLVPEQLHVYAITIGVDPSGSPQDWTNGRSRADEVLRKVKAGAPFEEMAREYSTDPSKARGGDMGFVHRGSLTPEFETATRNLGRGDLYDGIVQTIYGFHIVRVADVLAPRQKTFEEAVAEIRKDLGAKRCAEMAEAWLGRLRSAATIHVGAEQ